ncbi:MAG: hypothetical protein IPK70_05880 [Flavobacteriales bacterium]|jgi:hypothetical protein|nr:hypothetical protein [Flavobacteriales bacterium]
MKHALLALALGFGSAAKAQEPTKPVTEQQPTVAPVLPPRATPQTMAKELGLTDAQVEDLNRVDREYGDRYLELNRQNLEQQAKRARTIELREKKQADIQKAMTAEQWAQWQQMKQAQRDASLKAREERKAKPAHQE